MADILIRGMEMPTVCIDNGWYGNCPMDRSWCAQRFAPKDSTNESAHKEQWNKLPSWCPLRPIPEGHGRRGDLDALMNNIGDVPYKGAVRRVLMSAPTIVPAEGGGEDG